MARGAKPKGRSRVMERAPKPPPKAKKSVKRLYCSAQLQWPDDIDFYVQFGVLPGTAAGAEDRDHLAEGQAPPVLLPLSWRDCSHWYDFKDDGGLRSVMLSRLTHAHQLRLHCGVCGSLVLVGIADVES